MSPSLNTAIGKPSGSLGASPRDAVGSQGAVCSLFFAQTNFWACVALLCVPFCVCWSVCKGCVPVRLPIVFWQSMAFYPRRKILMGWMRLATHVDVLLFIVVLVFFLSQRPFESRICCADSDSATLRPLCDLVFYGFGSLTFSSRRLCRT